MWDAAEIASSFDTGLKTSRAPMFPAGPGQGQLQHTTADVLSHLNATGRRFLGTFHSHCFDSAEQIGVRNRHTRYKGEGLPDVRISPFGGLTGSLALCNTMRNDLPAGPSVIQ